jgi:hypothetical protein
MFVYQKSMLAERGNFFLLKIKGDRTEEGRSNEKEVSIAQQVRQGQLASDEGITSFLLVEDAARATLLALDWLPGILDDEPAPGTVWLPVYAATLGVPVPPMTAGQPHATRGATNRKARQLLHWEPVYPGWQEGFLRVAQEWRSQVKEGRVSHED